jgi:hypothetical protein
MVHWVTEIRSQDNKDRIVNLNLVEGTFEEIDYHDEAWIGGPGIPSTPTVREL